MKQSSPYKIYFLMFLATFFWAGAFIAAKLGVYDLSPVLLTFLRMGLAAVILFPILVFKQKQTWQLELSELKYVLATAIVGMIGYHLFFFTALKYTTASNASMINATNPLITALLATYFAGERLSIKKIMLLLMALTGVLYIITKGNLISILELDFNKGDFIMLCGTFLWAVYGILVKKIVPMMGPLKLTTYSFLFCAVLLLPFATYDFIKTQAYLVGGSPYLAVVYMAIFPTVIGYSIQQLAIQEIGPSKASLFINCVPILSTLLAVLFLGEAIYSYHFIGAALIIAAVLLYNIGSDSRRPIKDGEVPR